MAAHRRGAPPTARGGRPASPSAEDLLERAIAARSPISRARWAAQGLAVRRLDGETRALLLRQASLAHYELGDFARAREQALGALELGVLPDVAHQDVARAALAEGDVASAIEHLRRAARRAPASRRSFHLWTLGSILFLLQRYAEAAAVLERAARWGTSDKPLYRAHLALVRLAMGARVDDLQTTIDDLAAAACGRGYGRFVLGHLAYASGAWGAARRYLARFVRGVEAGGGAVAIALDAELRMARATLVKMSMAGGAARS